MSRFRARVGLLACAAAAGVCACTAGDRAAPTSLAWSACGDVADVRVSGLPTSRLDRIEASCATLEVPLDAADSEAGTVRLQLVRVHQAGEVRTPLLLIAGGPGQSGVELATYAPEMLPESLLDRFDLVGFDPRGVGRSDPITCPSGADVPAGFPDFATDEGFARGAEVMRSFADRCRSALGRTASLYSTVATAADIEAIRQALGVEQLSYIGWSYGAKLGAEYARQHGDRVRAAVLDAPTDPTIPWWTTVEKQTAGFEASFDRFAAWCAARTSCASVGDARVLAASVIAQAERAPIASGRPGDAEPTSGLQVVSAIASALYDETRWSDLAAGLLEAANGDSGTLRDLEDASRGDDEHAGDAQFVINCNDSGDQPTLDRIRAAGASLVQRYPMFGRWSAWQLFGCAFWDVARHPLQPPVVASATPILVVGTRHDPATPYSGAVSMATSLGRARLLTWEGGGHTAVGRSACITALVETYLDSLVLPDEASSTCPADG